EFRPGGGGGTLAARFRRALRPPVALLSDVLRGRLSRRRHRRRASDAGQAGLTRSTGLFFSIGKEGRPFDKLRAGGSYLTHGGALISPAPATAAHRRAGPTTASGWRHG